MSWRRFALAVPIILLGFADAPAQTADPAGPVRRLYSAYGIGDTPDLGKLSRQNPATLYSRSLLALYRRAAKAGLDFDFFVQGQDFSLAKPVEIGSVTTSGDKASVAAALTSNFVDAKTHRKTIDRFVFSLVREDGGWRIDEARHGNQSLRQQWQEMIKNPPDTVPLSAGPVHRKRRACLTTGAGPQSLARPWLSHAHREPSGDHPKRTAARSHSSGQTGSQSRSGIMLMQGAARHRQAADASMTSTGSPA